MLHDMYPTGMNDLFISIFIPAARPGDVSWCARELLLFYCALRDGCKYWHNVPSTSLFSDWVAAATCEAAYLPCFIALGQMHNMHGSESLLQLDSSFK